MIYRPDSSRGLWCYVDTDFSGGWKDDDQKSPESVLSRTSFVTMYSGCQIHWGSKIQTEISLSTTESNYIALSTSTWELITFMSLMKETAGLFGILTKDPVFRCALWKDNERCITVAKIPQFTPRAKHFAIKYHQFWCFLSNVKITMNSIGTTK